MAFISDGTNLVSTDTNGLADVFTAPNPLIEPGLNREIQVGDAIGGLNLGLIPNRGEISGRLFEDIVENSVIDEGEPLLAERTVFLDANGNRSLDAGEVFVTTGEDGAYRFSDLPAMRDHVIDVVVPQGFEQVAPAETGSGSRVFLPAGGSVEDADFGFRRIAGTGQSTNSSVSGRIFDDRNGNGQYDEGTDSPVANAVVYLDEQNFGVRDANEPAVETDADGRYQIGQLGPSIVSVSTILRGDLVHRTPLGSEFELDIVPLFDDIRPFGNPQSIAAADFNDDSLPDVAVALSEANQISIRINEGDGGFVSDEIDIDLGTNGGGPMSLVVGQFNGAETPLDVAVANNFAANVMVLLDFDGADFESRQTIAVGDEPLDLALAQITGDADHLDFVVVNRADSTIQALLNDGQGSFSAAQPVNTGGRNPISIVTGPLIGDEAIDVAIVHAAPSSPDSPFGDVRVFAGDGTGGFSLMPEQYLVGATPTDLVAADFDGDETGRLDLAVSNFGSNSISILTGNDNDTFTVQPQTLGTASGAFDIAAGDIDNDGDVDIVASNLADRNVSVFRNTTDSAVSTNFQPLEGVGLGQFGIVQRMPLVLVDLDGNESGSAEGTLDIVAIPRNTDTLHVLSNTLINGSHRVELTGVNEVSGLDFVVQPAGIPPTLDFIGPQGPIDEDTERQSVALTGIGKGREDGPPLRFNSTTTNPGLIADLLVEHTDGDSSGTLNFSLVANANGTATIEVTVTDAGADGAFDTSDDIGIVRSFDVDVTPLNDPPTFVISDDTVITGQNSGVNSIPGFVTGIGVGGGVDESGQSLSAFALTTDEELFAEAPAIDAAGTLTFSPAVDALGTALVRVRLTDDGGTANQGVDTTMATFAITVSAITSDTIRLTGAGETLSLGDSSLSLEGIRVIDITGSGDNTLLLDADRVSRSFADGTVDVISNAGDTIVFDTGWEFDQAFDNGTQVVRRFMNGNAILNLIGPNDYANPMSEFDVNASGDVTSSDALVVINELGRRLFSTADSSPTGALRDTANIDLSQFQFFDVSADDHVTGLDALRVINQLARQANESELIALWDSSDDDLVLETDRMAAASVDAVFRGFFDE